MDIDLWMPKERPRKGIAWALAMGVGVSAKGLQGMDQRQLQLPTASFPQILGQKERGLHIRQFIVDAQPHGAHGFRSIPRRRHLAA